MYIVSNCSMAIYLTLGDNQWHVLNKLRAQVQLTPVSETLSSHQYNSDVFPAGAKHPG